MRAIYQNPPDKWPAPSVDSTVKWKEIGLLPENEYSKILRKDGDPKLRTRVELGKMLFFDPRISGSGQLACASCHEAELGWSDGRSTSFGHTRKELTRNAPTLLNIGLANQLFWDGRAKDLEDQARQVLMNPDEMKSSPDVIGKLSAVPAYSKKFAAVFGDEEITFDRAAEMLAEFQRSIVGGRSRFDFFLKGRPEMLPDDAVIGLHLFRTQANCMNCHNGPNFSDNQFHNLGLTYYGREKYEDFGRYNITKDPADMGKFKTPTLRNVERTRPYMHNGLFELTGVLNMYNAGMPDVKPRPDQVGDPLFPKKSPLLRPLNLNRQEMNFIIAFLESLSEPASRVRVDLPPDVKDEQSVSKPSHSLDNSKIPGDPVRDGTE
ncbi:MAG: cytochrome c peroxidase [Pirellulales bacterium]